MHRAFSCNAAADPAVLPPARMEGSSPRNGAPAVMPPFFFRVVCGLVAANSGLTLEVLTASHRCAAPVAQARQLAMYVAHVGLGVSQLDVARAFMRDRSTVAHACHRIEDLRENDTFDAQVSRLENGARWILQGATCGQEG